MYLILVQILSAPFFFVFDFCDNAFENTNAHKNLLSEFLVRC